MKEIIVPLLGEFLKHALWQGCLIAVLLAVLLQVGRNASASLRYGLCCLALLAMVALPVWTAVSTVPLPAYSSTQLSHGVAAIDADESVVPLSQEPEFQPAPPPRYVVPVTLWLVGVALLALLRLASWWRVTRLTRSRYCEDVPHHLRQWLEAVQHELGMQARVLLCYCHGIQVPCAIGMVRPKILLPRKLLEALNESQVKAILAHELMHIKRHDYLANLLQTVVETLLFFHPAVWWVGRCLRIEREHCCDDGAVKVCDKPVVYGQALLRLEEARDEGMRFAMSARGSHRSGLALRVRRLLETNISARHRRRFPFLATALLPLAVMAGAAWLILPGLAQDKFPTPAKDPNLSRIQDLTDKLSEAVHGNRPSVLTVTFERQLQLMGKLEGDELYLAAANFTSDPTLTTLWPTYQKFRLTKEAMLASGLGHKHPKIKEVEAKITSVGEMMDAAVESIRRTLETKLEMARKAQRNDPENSKETDPSKLAELVFELQMQVDQFVASQSNYSGHSELLTDRDALLASGLGEKHPQVQEIDARITAQERLNRSSAQKSIIVSGEVKAPRRISWIDDLTVRGALHAADGVTDWAAPANGRLIRNGESEKIDLTNSKQLDRVLLPGDKIIVPHK